jgi:hypothetical protein
MVVLMHQQLHELCLNLYTIVKSYTKNNNNDLVIIPETYGLLTK